ncbi:MAG: Lrp/AsnC ligand binding domain-containing protein [Sphingomonadaceae bacterium]|nr:Lrp/AsnC ligand binding domain-containing protein [Sphingomonadaceae bacterium]
MKQRFYVFMQCEPGHTYDVGMAIISQKRDYVADVSSVSGHWDLLLRIEIDNRKDVGRELAGALAGLEHVTRTETIVAYPIFDPDDVYFGEDGDP